MHNRLHGLGPSVPCPPKKPPGYLQVEKVTPANPIKGVVLSPYMIGLNMHFSGTRTIMCLRHIGVCPPCQAGKPDRWYGFIAIAKSPHWTPRLLSLTVGAVQNCPPLELHNGHLRGRRIVVTRMGRSSNSPMKVEIGEQMTMKEDSENPDLEYALQCLYGLREGELNGPGFGLFCNGKGEDE